MKNLIIILFAGLLMAGCKKSEIEHTFTNEVVQEAKVFVSHVNNRVVPSGDYFVIMTPEQVSKICEGVYPQGCNYYFTVDTLKATIAGNSLTGTAWFTDRGAGRAKVDMAIFVIDPNGDAIPPFYRDTIIATTNAGLRSPLSYTKNISFLNQGNHILAVAIRATYNGGDWAHNQVWFNKQ